MAFKLTGDAHERKAVGHDLAQHVGRKILAAPNLVKAYKLPLLAFASGLDSSDLSWVESVMTPKKVEILRLLLREGADPNQLVDSSCTGTCWTLFVGNVFERDP